MSDYVVPARRLLTVVHIRNPDVPEQHRTEADPKSNFIGTRLTADSHDGHTMCGTVMRADEQWIDWDPAVAADRICSECQAGTAPYVEEGLF